MDRFWREDAAFISPFDLQHLGYILIVVTLLGILLANRARVKAHRKRIAKIVLVISVLQQLMLYTWYGLEMGCDISESLPLHLSRITALLGVYFLITKNLKVLDIIFFFGLYAYGSFLYPQRVYEIGHIIGLSFLINHAITLLLPYFGYIAYGWRPSLKSLGRAYLWFVIYFFFVYFLNPLIDGNYFYLKYRPFFSDWPDYIYIPVVLGVTLAGFLLAYQVVRIVANRGPGPNSA